MGSGRQRRERSGVKRRGRRATFPDIDADTPLDGINLATITETHDPRRFRVLLQDGGERLVDLTSWPHPSFTIAMAPLVQEHIRQLGPAPVGRSIYCKVLDLRQFWRFLDAAGVRIDGLDGMTADLIDSYENWLRHNGKSEQHLRRVLSHLISLMRLAVEMYPGRFPPDMEHRLSWLGSGEFIHSRPRDAYSSGIAAALRSAARKQITEAAARILLGDTMPGPRPDIAANPKLSGFYAEVLLALARDGKLSTRVPPLRLLKSGLQNSGSPPLSSTTLHGTIYLTRLDFIAFLVSLTGHRDRDRMPQKPEGRLSPQSDTRLCRGRISQTSRAGMETSADTRRGQFHTWRDHPSGHQPDGAGAPISGTDALWAYWDGYKLLEGRNSRGSVEAFVTHHALTDHEGCPLKLELSRLRKTHKAERYLQTHGQLADFAIGHSIPVAANHYADIPALSPFTNARLPTPFMLHWMPR
jgi:hypothetical protein